MIQFNLLPDIKIEYIKARRNKRMVMLGSGIVAGISAVIAISLFVGVNVVQRQHLGNLKDDVERDSQRLQDEPDIARILTVQNQLNVLDDLHAQKPAASRLRDYIGRLTPRQISISEFEIDFTTNTMTFDGTAAALRDVNQFVDAMKFTTFEAGEQQGNAFSSVVLASFGRSDTAAASGDQAANFQVTLAFNPVIFNNAHNVRFEVPEGTTTRSSREQSTLFNQSTDQEAQ